MSGPRVSTSDQLRAAMTRRDQAADLLIRSLIEIDTLTTRIDVLLERLHAEQDA